MAIVKQDNTKMLIDVDRSLEEDLNVNKERVEFLEKKINTLEEYETFLEDQMSIAKSRLNKMRMAIIASSAVTLIALIMIVIYHVI